MAKENIESPLGKAWKRLKKNRPAIFGLVIIVIAIFLAIFGPVMAPDSTPNANDQVLEIAKMNPGFTTQMLLVRKNREEKHPSFLSVLFLGKDNDNTMVPIKNYKIHGDSIDVEVNNGPEVSSSNASYSLLDVAYPLSIMNKNISKQGDKITFYDASEKKQVISESELQALVKKEHIVTKKYQMGTDNYGRDILSRLLFGVRVSISVGFVSVLISLTIGIFLGALAGFYKGRTDSIIMWVINVVWSIPTILLAMAISFALGNLIDGFWIIYIAVGLSMWVDVARIVRGQVLGVREMEYVQAARGLGYHNGRIIFRHILPNIIGPIMVITSANFASAILIEAGLSFVGIGVKPPMPSWGVLLNEHREYLTTPGKAWLELYPGLCIATLVLAFNLLGNGLSDAFDVRSRTNN